MTRDRWFNQNAFKNAVQRACFNACWQSFIMWQGSKTAYSKCWSPCVFAKYDLGLYVLFCFFFLPPFQTFNWCKYPWQASISGFSGGSTVSKLGSGSGARLVQPFLLKYTHTSLLWSCSKCTLTLDSKTPSLVLKPQQQGQGLWYCPDNSEQMLLGGRLERSVACRLPFRHLFQHLQLNSGDTLIPPAVE